MWSIEGVKKRAWDILTTNYWWAFLTVLIFSIVAGMASGIVSAISSLFTQGLSTGMTLMVSIISNSSSSRAILVQSVVAVILMILIYIIIISSAVAVIVFVTYPLQYGLVNWFIHQRNEVTYKEIDVLFSAFKKGTYKRVATGMGWGYLWQFIWSFVSSFVFIIPMVTTIFIISAVDHYADNSDIAGLALAIALIVCMFIYVLSLALYLVIVFNRVYAYLYIPYILAEEPELSYREVMNKSKKMSDGQKGKMFLLDLSFIGWWCLVFLTCGTLSIFLTPYVQAARTEMYFARKEELAG